MLNSDKLIFFISEKSTVFANESYAKAKGLRMAKNILQLDDEAANEKSQKVAKIVLEKHIYPYENDDNWSMKQSYIALGMAMYSASILGIGSTPMERFSRDKIEELFLAKKIMSKTKESQLL